MTVVRVGKNGGNDAGRKDMVRPANQPVRGDFDFARMAGKAGLDLKEVLRGAREAGVKVREGPDRFRDPTFAELLGGTPAELHSRRNVPDVIGVFEVSAPVRRVTLHVTDGNGGHRKATLPEAVAGKGVRAEFDPMFGWVGLQVTAMEYQNAVYRFDVALPELAASGNGTASVAGAKEKVGG